MYPNNPSQPREGGCGVLTHQRHLSLPEGCFPGTLTSLPTLDALAWPVCRQGRLRQPEEPLDESCSWWEVEVLGLGRTGRGYWGVWVGHKCCPPDACCVQSSIPSAWNGAPESMGQVWPSRMDPDSSMSH